jgi:hypothetical protein
MQVQVSSFSRGVKDFTARLYAPENIAIKDSNGKTSNDGGKVYFRSGGSSDSKNDPPKEETTDNSDA